MFFYISKKQHIAWFMLLCDSTFPIITITTITRYGILIFLIDQSCIQILSVFHASLYIFLCINILVVHFVGWDNWKTVWSGQLTPLQKQNSHNIARSSPR